MIKSILYSFSPTLAAVLCLRYRELAPALVAEFRERQAVFVEESAGLSGGGLDWL